MIYFDKVSKVYSPTSIALEDVSFSIEPQEFVSVVGQSGSGKTTLLKLLLADEKISGDVPQVLELVGLVDKAWHFPSELSGGELQRVAIARAIVNRPDVILADEPTGNLDPINTWEIIGLLDKINELGTTVILATHDKDVINSLKRRVVTLEKGKIVRDEKRGRYVL